MKDKPVTPTTKIAVPSIPSLTDIVMNLSELYLFQTNQLL
jgi:hypothetical protein